MATAQTIHVVCDAMSLPARPTEVDGRWLNDGITFSARSRVQRIVGVTVDTCVTPISVNEDTMKAKLPSDRVVFIVVGLAIGVLSDLSTRGDTESRPGLASVVSEISLALARKQTDWVSSASELQHFNPRNAERAEAAFSQYAVQLRTKVGTVVQ